MKKPAMLFGLVLMLGLLPAPSAAAETNPDCPDVEQIGTTAHIEVDGATFASVKQFKGCDQNWGYLYVWESWRENHSQWSTCISVASGNEPPYALEDLRCYYSTSRVEMWSSGADTLNVCTHAVGSKVNSSGTTQASARTNIRC